jgi:peptidoglycan hydrolase CwlO-like protein
MPNLIHLSQIKDGIKISVDLKSLDNQINNTENGLVNKISELETENKSQNQRLESVESQIIHLKWATF